jgi:hypothetical protein
MEETIRLKLEQVCGVAFLRLPEWPFEEPHISKFEGRGPRRDSWFHYSAWRRRVVLPRRRSECEWKSVPDGRRYGARAHTLKYFTASQTMFTLKKKQEVDGCLRSKTLTGGPPDT